MSIPPCGGRSVVTRQSTALTTDPTDLDSGLEHHLDAAVLLVAEGLVHLRPLLDRNRVGDDEGRVDLALADAAQEIVGPAVHVGLAHAPGEALVHRGAERDLVDEPAIDARNRERAGRAADIDHLAQHMRPVALGHHRLLDAIVHGIDVARYVGLHADAIDALLRALAMGELLQALDDALLVEVDGDGAAGARHVEALGDAVDRDHLLRSEQHGRADRHLPDGSGAPDRDRVLGIDVALDRGLPAGREDVAEKQDLLVGKAAVRHLDVGLVGKRHAHVFGLAAGIAAGEVGVAEETRGRSAEDLRGHVLVAVRRLADREVAAPALLAFAAENRERHDDAVADLERALGLRADLHDLAHELVADDVAVLHPWHVAVVEIQVRAADGTGRHPDDSVAGVLDLRIRDLVAADVGGVVPNQGFHRRAPLAASEGRQLDPVRGRRAVDPREPARTRKGSAGACICSRAARTGIHRWKSAAPKARLEAGLATLMQTAERGFLRWR